MKTIVIIAQKVVWEEAWAKGKYTQSTIDTTLAEVGFIHATFPDQTMEIVPRFKEYEDVILLLVDAERVAAPIKYEASLSGRAGTFPHIYGLLNVDAVYDSIALKKDKNGEFMEPEQLRTARA